MFQVNSLMVSGPDDKYFATCSDDGSLRVWTADELEQTLQFQVMDQVRKGLIYLGYNVLTIKLQQVC